MPVDIFLNPLQNKHSMGGKHRYIDSYILVTKYSFRYTVIGCIATNARLRKPEACRIADLAHTGIARTVSPVHTSLDGDALFTLATGEVEAGLDLVAELAARAVADAVRAAVRHAHGIPADPRAQRTT